MDLLTKLNKENGNTSCIYLYAEGIFYEAYERSAYAFVMHIQPFKVRRMHPKKAKQDVLSIGFPISSVDKILAARKYNTDENGNLCVILNPDETISEDDYLEWQTRAKHELSTIQEKVNPERIVEIIRNFPMKDRSTIECILFLGDLKKLCSVEPII